MWKLLFLSFFIVACGAEGPAGKDGAPGEQGPAGKDGLTIASMANIDSFDDNLCTRYTNEWCYFSGGSVKRYTNGLVEFEGRLFYHVVFDYTISNDSDSRWITTLSMTVGQEDAWALVPFQRIQRWDDDDEKLLWLVYIVDQNKFQLVYDTNNNERYESFSDEVIKTLTESSVYQID